jgi:rsbT co-antagonist protein RsbR
LTPIEQSVKRDDHQSRLASVGQIAAGIAHEVRNPLTAVKGFLQLLGEQVPHNYIDIAQQELDNAIETLQNLLNVSRPDAESEPMVGFSLCAELEAILGLFQDQFYRVAVNKHFTDGTTEIIGRRNQLKKVFFNILKNAFEAIPGEGTIEIHHSLEGDTVCVSITDTGVGIPQDKLAMLGTPFFTTKTDGTGMGLAYVFSIVYQHGGTVDVQSMEGQGTTFTFHFPIRGTKERDLAVMDLLYEQDMKLGEFLKINRGEFEHCLLAEAENVKGIIEDIKKIGNIDLVQNAHILVGLLVDQNDWEIINFAQQEGKLWSQHSSLNLAVKLEWFQAIRRVLWSFMYNFDRLSGNESTREQFFSLERQTNNSLDTFLRHFFMSYTKFKDDQIKSHMEMIDDLSVPIIPLTSSVSILPLLGMIDSHRIQVIQEKVLQQIGLWKFRTLLIDMSGAAFPDTMNLRKLSRILNGISYMGVKAIITGIRPEVANTMINSKVMIDRRIETKGTLQQALEQLGLNLN